MFQGFKKIMIGIYILIPIILNAQTMNQIYFTQDGKPYVLKQVGYQNAVITGGVAEPFYHVVKVNLENVPSGSSFLTETALNFKTDKKIIPLLFATGVIQAGTPTGGTTMNQSDCYYWTLKGAAGNEYKAYLGPLSKNVPYIDRIFFTDTSNYAWNIQYNQTVYHSSDFLDTTGGLWINFNQNLGNALFGNTEIPAALNPGFQFLFSHTFVYFELL